MDTISVLCGLSKVLGEFDGSAITYFSRKSEDENFSSVASLSVPWVKNAWLPEWVSTYGIRSMTINSIEELCMDSDTKDGNPCLFERCRAIAFDDWAALPNASDIWDSFLRGIIRPLKRSDFEFIFYLGDTRRRSFFQIDEILDIISDFSIYGRVTFALDKNEALDLCKLVNGIDAGQDFTGLLPAELTKEFRSIFLTMKIGQLLVYTTEEAILLSNGPTLVLSRKPVDTKIDRSDNARDNFVAGFSIGLGMQLELPYCIALGLTVFGISGEGAAIQSQDGMLSYISKWVKEIEGNIGHE